jgi:hypothetical protein
MQPLAEQEIQDFIAKVERELEDLPLEDKQKGLLELKEKLNLYHQRFPQRKVEETKFALGGVKQAANMIRFEKYYPLRNVPRQTAQKMLLAFLAFSFLSFAALISFLWWKFTPLYQENEEKIVVLGGLIEVDRQLGQLKVGDSFDYGTANYNNIFEGSFEVPQNATEDITLEFDKGQFEFSFSADSRISWNCKVAAEPSDSFIRQESELVLISLKGIGGADCTFKLPSRVKYIITGESGKN